MPRGGRRQGTPGKGYSNRSDLATDYMGTGQSNTAATGGMTAPASAPAQMPMGQPQGPLVGADEVPNLSDPTMRPGEPLMTGINMGSGQGREALGVMPPSPADPVRQILETMMLTSPNPDIARALQRLDVEGR